MPDWTAPFEMPHLTTEEFEKMRAKYIAEYGYRIGVPNYKDVIKIPMRNPITDAEQAAWRAKKFNLFSPERYAELAEIKRYNKEKFLDMLADPAPEVLRSRASILTAIDNAQDAISTVVAIAQVGSLLLPLAAKKIIAGPVGWIALGADCLNFMMHPTRLAGKSRDNKRTQDAQTKDNPKSKKAKLKKANKLKKLKLKRGAWVETLQTTENIFGFGISLGALMNLPIAIASGFARKLGGAKVTVSWPQPDWAYHQRRIMQAQIATMVRLSHPHKANDEEISTLLISSNCAMQAQQQINKEWPPADLVPDPGSVEIMAPFPTNILVTEVLDEEDPGWKQRISWPVTGKQWSTVREVIEASAPAVTETLNDYMKRNKHNELGLIGSLNASQSGMYALQAIEGPGCLEYDYTAWCKTFHALQELGYRPPAELTESQMKPFLAWLNEFEADNSCPTTPEVLAFVKNNCGWEFIHRP